MTAPVGGYIGEWFKTMGDTMVDFLFVRVCLIVRFTNAFRNHLRVTFAMASVLAVGTLHASRILQEISTKSTTHNVIKLLRNELMPLLFVDFLFFLADGSLTVEAYIERSSSIHLLDCPRLLALIPDEQMGGKKPYRNSS